jgi:hypothetical protein
MMAQPAARAPERHFNGSQVKVADRTIRSIEFIPARLLKFLV